MNKDFIQKTIQRKEAKNKELQMIKEHKKSILVGYFKEMFELFKEIEENEFFEISKDGKIFNDELLNYSIGCIGSDNLRLNAVFNSSSLSLGQKFEFFIDNNDDFIFRIVYMRYKREDKKEMAKGIEKAKELTVDYFFKMNRKK